MDFDTALQFILAQGASSTALPPDAFLTRLSQGKPPIPGQLTSLLLALKVLFEGLRAETQLDRTLVSALYMLANESRSQFERGRRAGVNWPPLLDEDLTRIAIAVRGIFSGVWEL